MEIVPSSISTINSLILYISNIMAIYIEEIILSNYTKISVLNLNELCSRLNRILFNTYNKEYNLVYSHRFKC